MTVTYWWCLGNPPTTPPCEASGEYIHTAAGGASGPAHKHTQATGHTTNTSTQGAA